MGKKSTAHRRSESDKQYVTTSDGRKVRNTAYKPRSRRKERGSAEVVTRQGAFTQDTLRVKKDGTVEFRDADGNLHRADGPAVFNPDIGHEEYYRHGKLHRADGPAIVSENGQTEEWYVDGIRHNTTGPAVKNRDETRWYVAGKLHRTDGPALETATGVREYWKNGELQFAENVTDPLPDEPAAESPTDSD